MHGKINCSDCTGNVCVCTHTYAHTHAHTHTPTFTSYCTVNSTVAVESICTHYHVHLHVHVPHTHQISKILVNKATKTSCFPLYYMYVNSQTSIFQSYLYKFLGQFERRALKAKVVAWRAGQNETKVDMDEVTFTVDQDVPIVSEVGKQSSIKLLQALLCGGGLAQMVERSLSMREVPGSIPGSSSLFFLNFPQIHVKGKQYCFSTNTASQ